MAVDGGEGEEEDVAGEGDAERGATAEFVSHGANDHVAHRPAGVLRGGDGARPRRDASGVQTDDVAEEVRKRRGEQRHAEVVREGGGHSWKEGIARDACEASDAERGSPSRVTTVVVVILRRPRATTFPRARRPGCPAPRRPADRTLVETRAAVDARGSRDAHVRSRARAPAPTL